MRGNKIVSFAPNDLVLQIVSNFSNNSDDVIRIPNKEEGYFLSPRLFLSEIIRKEFCGVIEISTIFFNEDIKSNILDNLMSDNTKFDIFVRQTNPDNSPKIVQEFRNCIIYRKEFGIPETGLTAFNRYHFSNSSDPWYITNDQINTLRPPNQYIYDYAVSKAIKNLNNTLEKNIGRIVQDGSHH